MKTITTHLVALELQLLERSWACLDGVLPLETLDELRAEALSDLRSGEFHEARIGKGIQKQRIQEVRSDKVHWWQRVTASEAQDQYWQLMDVFRERLSNYFRIHLERTELHYAVYPEGAFYAPHVDQFKEQSDRIFSVITYLNPDWKPGDGGELRILHDDGTWEDLAPLHGRMVIFRSDAILHEVRVAHAQRVSVTGWMRRDALIY